MEKQEEIKLMVDSFCVYKGIFQEEIGDKFKRLVDKIYSSEYLIESIEAYNDFAYELFINSKNLSFKSAIVDQMLISNNVFFIDFNEKIPEMVTQCIKNELIALEKIANISSRDIKNILIEKHDADESLHNKINALMDWGIGQEEYNAKNKTEFETLKEKLINSDDWSSCIHNVIGFHKKNGTGRSTAYYAFVWERFENEKEGRLREIAEPDPVRLSDLVGYESQKEQIIDNTRNFLKGVPSNNLLLYGSRGTGKSSTVKAILNEYYQEGLRLIEVDKDQLSDFTRIIRLLRDKKQKFIIFVDDLVFAENEASYSALKTILEGRIENRPDNILIYATTNRRHLVKESFSERDDVHYKDTQEEQLSLADRFGITISFFTPNQKEFLTIVDGIVEAKKIQVDTEYLHREALKWEKWNNGRSPRSARQFIDWLQGELAKNNI